MELTFVNTAGTTLTAQLEPDMTADDVVAELVSHGFIAPVSDFDNRHGINYSLFVSGKGRIEGRQTIADSMFEDGDCVSLVLPCVSLVLPCVDGARFVVISQTPANNTKIRVTCKYNGQVWFLKFDNPVSIDEVHLFLSEKYGVPQYDIQIIKENGEPGDLSVNDGSIFEFRNTVPIPSAKTVAYGPPGSFSTPGLTPDCTSTDFDEIDSSLIE